MSGTGPWTTPGGEEPPGGPEWAQGPREEGSDGPPPPPPPPAPPGSSVPPPPPPGTWGGGWPAAPARQRVGVVPLYPMGVGDILDTSFRLLRVCAGPAALLVLLVLGPLQVLASTAFVSPFEVFNNPVPTQVDGTMLVLSTIGGVLSLVLSPLLMTALTWMAAHADADTAPDWRAALRQGARRYWATLGAFLLLAVVGGGATAAAVVLLVLVAAGGGGIVAVLLGIPLMFSVVVLVVGLVALGYLTVPCIVVEELGPIAGLRRAWRLLRARFWPTIGVSLAVGLVFTVLGTAVSSAISLPALFGLPGGWVFIAVGGILDSLVRVPLGAFAALAIHVDQRIRTEGYDVAVLVSELRR